MAKPKHRKLPEDVRRAAIINAARLLFCRQGFERTRMDDVAAQAGLTKGGLYFHFKNKRQVMEAVVNDRVQALARHMDDLEQMPGDPEEVLRATLQVFLREMAENIALAAPGSDRYYPGPLELFLEGQKMSADNSEVAAIFNRVRSHVARLVETGKRQGRFPGADPEAASVAAVGAVQGLYLQYGFDPKAFDLMDMGSRIFEQFMQGLRGPARGSEGDER